MAHRSALRKERQKKTETSSRRARTPLNLFASGGVLVQEKKEEKIPEKKREEGWRGLGGWWRGVARLKAYCNNESNSSKCDNCEENADKEEKKCIIVPYRNVKKDCMIPRRSIFGGRSKSQSFAEEKVPDRKAVSFCKEVNVVLIPNKSEISAEVKASLWWNASDSREFQRRLVAHLPAGTDLTKSLLILGKMCMDLAEIDDSIQSDADNESTIYIPVESFEEQKTKSCTTGGGEEKTNEVLCNTSQEQYTSPEVCTATIMTPSESATENNWDGVLSTLGCSTIPTSMASTTSVMVDKSNWQQTLFDFDTSIPISDFSECRQPTTISTA